MKDFYMETDWTDTNGEKLEITNEKEYIEGIKIQDSLMDVYDVNAGSDVAYTVKNSFKLDQEDELGETIILTSATTGASKNYVCESRINIISLATAAYDCISKDVDIYDHEIIAGLINDNKRILAEFMAEEGDFIIANMMFEHAVELCTDKEPFAIANGAVSMNNNEILLEELVTAVNIENVKLPCSMKLKYKDKMYNLIIEKLSVKDSPKPGIANVIAKFKGVEKINVEPVEPVQAYTNAEEYVKGKIKYMKDKKAQNDDASFLDDLFL